MCRAGSWHFVKASWKALYPASCRIGCCDVLRIWPVPGSSRMLGSRRQMEQGSWALCLNPAGIRWPFSLRLPPNRSWNGFCLAGAMSFEEACEANVNFCNPTLPVSSLMPAEQPRQQPLTALEAWCRQTIWWGVLHNQRAGRVVMMESSAFHHCFSLRAEGDRLPLGNLRWLLASSAGFA